MYLPSPEPGMLWHQAVAAVGAEWPVVRAIEPDSTASPPRDGVIESAWVEPRGPAAASWPPRRQRIVVRVAPTASGAWIDAMIETQTLSEPSESGVESMVALTAGWSDTPTGADATTRLAARLAPLAEPVYALPAVDRRQIWGEPQLSEPPWAGARFPRLARAGRQIAEDYRNFYACENLVCLTAAFGAGALMANTGFDDTLQASWQRGVTPTGLGTFFSGCKDIGEGRYVLPIFGAAAVTGLVFESRPAGDMLLDWGGRSLRMFVVGAPPVYALQWATGASRPGETSAGSDWKPFSDNNGVSGHAFVGAIPFLAAADMVESPLLKGSLYVCSTFVAFSRVTDNAHYPSQAFLGWYLAWASARAVDATEMQLAGLEVRVVPLPMADLGGMAVEARW
jgi:hypothetical protein